MGLSVPETGSDVLGCSERAGAVHVRILGESSRPLTVLLTVAPCGIPMPLDTNELALVPVVGLEPTRPFIVPGF